MNFSCRLKGGDENIRPVRIFDDGKKAYIQISEAAKNSEALVLVVIGPDGKQEMVNYRVKDDMYIVDRVFEKAQLILGSGKKARKVPAHSRGRQQKQDDSAGLVPWHFV